MRQRLAVRCCNVMLKQQATRGLEDYHNDHVDVAVCCATVWLLSTGILHTNTQSLEPDAN
jgi:hypothetical protein